MNSDNFKQNFINAVLGKLSSNTKYSPEIENWLQTLPEEQRIGAANGKNFGDKAILAKQQELNIPIPQGQEQLALANEGKFNPYTHGATRQGGLINGYNQGYNLNYDNPTDQISTRIGQALGTVKRGFDSPLGRALVAYGASRALGDSNPLKQAATAYGTRENANTANQLYRQQLNQLGIDTSNINGEINSEMYKNLLTGAGLNNKIVPLQTLAAMGDKTAINALANGANPYTMVPANLGNNLLTGVGAKNNALAGYYGAKTESEKQLLPYRIKQIDAQIEQGQVRLALYAQKVQNGTATDSDKAEYNRLRNQNMKLAIEKKELENNILRQYANDPNGNPLPVTNVPLNNTPAPQTVKPVAKNGVTKSGVKWEIVD